VSIPLCRMRVHPQRGHYVISPDVVHEFDQYGNGQPVATNTVRVLVP